MASFHHTKKEGETIGMGYISPPITGCTERHLWAAMKQTIRAVASSYPADQVRYKDKGALTWRSLRYIGTGAHQGETIKENIYINEQDRSIRFVQLDDADSETDDEVWNRILKDDNPCLGTTSGFELVPRIEYFKWNRSKKERIPFDLPKAEAIDAIERTGDIARVIQRSYGHF